MSTKFLIKAALVTTLCFSAPAMAAFGKFISQNDAVEAEKITINWDGQRQSGVALVTGCDRCPLRLNLDQQTRFFHNNQVVGPENAAVHSGKPGTAIYDSGSAQALKIRW